MIEMVALQMDMFYWDSFYLLLAKKGDKQLPWKTPQPLIFSFYDITFFISHGASEASGVRNFWHLSAKILYTVEPKTATSP